MGQGLLGYWSEDILKSELYCVDRKNKIPYLLDTRITLDDEAGVCRIVDGVSSDKGSQVSLYRFTYILDVAVLVAETYFYNVRYGNGTVIRSPYSQCAYVISRPR